MRVEFLCNTAAKSIEVASDILLFDMLHIMDYIMRSPQLKSYSRCKIDLFNFNPLQMALAPSSPIPQPSIFIAIKFFGGFCKALLIFFAPEAPNKFPVNLYSFSSQIN